MEVLKSTKELRELVNSINYKHCRLVSATGEVLIPGNRKADHLADQLKKICSRLDSKTLPDGKYFIQCGYQPAQRDTYDYFKGDPEKFAGLQEQRPVAIIREKVAPDKSSQVLSWEAALEYMNKISTLEAANATLTVENKRLQEKIDELEDQISDSGENLQEAGKKSPLMELAEAIMPAVNSVMGEYFTIRNREISLEEKKLGIVQQQKQQQQQPYQITQQDVELIDEILNGLCEQHPNLEAKIDQVIQSAPDAASAIQKIAQTMPDVWGLVIVELQKRQTNES